MTTSIQVANVIRDQQMAGFCVGHAYSIIELPISVQSNYIGVWEGSIQ